MKIKGIKPHVQPVRLDGPEPVKRFYTQSAAEGAADGSAGRRKTEEGPTAQRVKARPDAGTEEEADRDEGGQG